MRVIGFLFVLALAAAPIGAVSTVAVHAQAQNSDDPRALDAQLDELMRAGRYAEAEAAGKRALAASDVRLGPDHPLVGDTLAALARVYFVQDRFAEAETLLRRALVVFAQALPPDHEKIGRAMEQLGNLLNAMGRTTEAEPLAGRARTILEKSPRK